MIIKQQFFKLLDKVVLARIVFKPPFKASSALDHEARFVHVINGRSRLCFPKDQLNLRTTDSILMKCENFVNTWFENEEDEPSEAVIIHFYPEVLRYIYDDQIPEVFSLKKKVNANPVEKVPVNEMIAHFIGSLRFYFNNPSFITDDLIKIKVKELILILVNSDQSGRVESVLSDLFKSSEYEFKEVIHSNLYEGLNLQDLAFFTGLSLSSFKRKFKSVFGTSPALYIKTKWLEKAKNLLEKTDRRISEIAFDCGFNDVGYFSKSFASAYQHPPSEYRKQHLGQFSH